MQQLQNAMLQAAAQQNINLIVLIFLAANAHGDTQTMQNIVNNYAQQFSASVQQHMRQLLQACVQASSSEEALVQHLQQHLPSALKQQQQASSSEDIAQQVINKAMLH